MVNAYVSTVGTNPVLTTLEEAQARIKTLEAQLASTHPEFPQRTAPPCEPSFNSFIPGIHTDGSFGGLPIPADKSTEDTLTDVGLMALPLIAGAFLPGGILIGGAINAATSVIGDLIHGRKVNYGEAAKQFGLGMLFGGVGKVVSKIGGFFSKLAGKTPGLKNAPVIKHLTPAAKARRAEARRLASEARTDQKIIWKQSRIVGGRHRLGPTSKRAHMSHEPAPTPAIAPEPIPTSAPAVRPVGEQSSFTHIEQPNVNLNVSNRPPAITNVEHSGEYPSFTHIDQPNINFNTSPVPPVIRPNHFTQPGAARLAEGVCLGF